MPVISSCGLVTGTTLHVFTASMPMKLNSFIKNFENFGWEFLFGKNSTCHLPFA